MADNALLWAWSSLDKRGDEERSCAVCYTKSMDHKAYKRFRKRQRAVGAIVNGVSWITWGLMTVSAVLVMLAKGQAYYSGAGPDLLSGTETSRAVTIDQIIYKLRIDLNQGGNTTRLDQTNRANEYPLCHVDIEGLRPLDYSMLAALAYFEDNPAYVQRVLPRLFPAANASLRKNTTHQCTATSVVQEFSDFFIVDFPEKKLSVITVKGTDPARIMDVLTDVRLWAEAALLQLASFFVPTVRLWPHDLTSNVVKPVDCLQH